MYYVAYHEGGYILTCPDGSVLGCTHDGEFSKSSLERAARTLNDARRKGC